MENKNSNGQSRAVRYNQFGHIDVLYITDVPKPEPGVGEALVKIKAAGINPGEAAIREGKMAKMFPSTFPSGQGSDFAGIVEAIGGGYTALQIGDEVIGFSNNRNSQADYVVVPADQLVHKPGAISWEQAGGLFVAGTTAYAAVNAVALNAGETVIIAGAAGGVGSFAVQIAHHIGATVIGIAGEANHDWLKKHGVVSITHGDGMENRLKAALKGEKADAFIDLFGGGYVKLALELGIPKERINTIIDFAAVEEYGVKAEGNQQGAKPWIISELAELIANGQLEMPIAKTYPLAEVQQAYQELEKRHTRGKIVLIP